MTINSSTGLISWQPVAGQLGVHSVTVRASNVVGDVDQTFDINVLADTIGPTAPADFVVDSTTETSVTLSWTASTDAVGVDLCVEVLNRFESFMFNTVEQANRYLGLVDHPSVKIELDTFHMNVEEPDLAAAVRGTGGRLGHFQVAASNRAMPGKGHIDWDGLSTALDDIGYEGWVVVETFPNPDVETGRSTHAFRPLVTDLVAEAIEAAAFVRLQFGAMASGTQFGEV